MSAWPYGVRKTVGTWDMTPVELARLVAEHRGWYATEGGWVYDHRGEPIVQGWRKLAARLERAGWIVPGRGVAWSQLPRLAVTDAQLWYGHPRLLGRHEAAGSVRASSR